MKIKHVILISIVISFLINFLFILGNFTYSVIPQISTAIERDHNRLTDDLTALTAKITSEDDLEGVISRFAEENDISIYYELLDAYAEDEQLWENTAGYHVTTIFPFHDDMYIIKMHREVNTRTIPAVNAFIMFTVVVVTAVGIGIYLVTYKTVISPISKLEGAIKDYKWGVKPERASGRTEASVIRNSFVELVEQLEEEKEKQSRIIASISHDIKTPLTAILGYSYRVTNQQLLKERRMDYLDRIYKKAEALKELTEEFDDYLSCNIHSTLKLSDVTIGTLIKLLEDDFKEDLSDKNIKLIVDSHVDEDVTLQVDLAKIKRIFSNTITNSVRFIDSFGKIMVSIKDSKEHVEFTITDTGPGVPEENIKKIFEPLFTSDPSRKISGLGLAICQDIVQQHGGVIRAENSDNDGLSIIFTIKK